MVHVQEHTENYPSLICFSVDGMCSVSSSSACRRAASYSTLVIVGAHLGQVFSVQEVKCIKALPKKTGGRVGWVTKSKQSCFYSENTFLMEASHS